MKKIFLFLVMMTLVPIQTWAQDKEVDLIVNGEHIHDVVTIEQSGRTLISVRQLAEMLAADVNFEKKTVDGRVPKERSSNVSATVFN